MIFPTQNLKIYIATKPVDFRKGMDGLAAIVEREFNLDPLSSAMFIFRSKRADRLKIIFWDGTGLVLIYKRIEGQGFCWPTLRDGLITLSATQFEALFEGVDWRSVASRKRIQPRVRAQKAARSSAS